MASLYLLADEVNVGGVLDGLVCSRNAILPAGVLQPHSAGGGGQSVSEAVPGISDQLLLHSV